MINWRPSFVQRAAPKEFGVGHAFDKPIWNYSVLHGPTPEEEVTMKTWIRDLVCKDDSSKNVSSTLPFRSTLSMGARLTMVLVPGTSRRCLISMDPSPLRRITSGIISSRLRTKCVTQSNDRLRSNEFYACLGRQIYKKYKNLRTILIIPYATA